MTRRIQFLHLALCFVLLSCCGCGNSNIGSVEGIVLVDGNPIDQASIAFYPATGRASMGLTDAEGRYKLIYTQDSNGAVIGEHKVTISTEVAEEVEYGDSDYETEGADGKTLQRSVAEARKESLPEKYRDRNKTELTATVKSGSNEINFDLSTK